MWGVGLERSEKEYRDDIDEFESVVFGKPFPDRKTEWYPYESKTVCHVALATGCTSRLHD
jgi:hypothetical protein